MNLPFTFPVSLETFLDYQAHLIGHELPPSTKPIVGKWLPTINGAHKAGLEADHTEIKRSMDLVDGLIESNLGKQGYVGFMKVVRCWIALAWDHGREDARNRGAGK